MDRRGDELLQLLMAAIAAADPMTVVPPHLPAPPEAGRIVVLAAGKAAAAMALAAERHYTETLGLDPDRIDGIAVTRHGYGLSTRIVPVVEAGHPVPDQAGVDATRRALDLARGAGPDDLVVVLLSGGGSANWVMPRTGIDLAEKQALTRSLLASGASIGEINAVRKHLSAIKGGRLAEAAAPARLVTLAISDVPGDDPAVIASGPTVADPTTLADARAVLARYGIEPPASIAEALVTPADETTKADAPFLAGSRYEIVARPADALAAAATAARSLGYETEILGDDLEGEARHLAARHVALALDAADAGRRLVLLSGGEATVTVAGKGRGGPNQEYALAAAVAASGDRRLAVLAADTDGTDGGTGRIDDPAGALALPDTLALAARHGLDPGAALRHNDSTGFFEAIGRLVRTGPTYTNVNDFRAVIVDSRGPDGQ